MNNSVQTIRDTIIAMWNEGKSAGEIGKALGITRNAAIGVVSRFRGSRRHGGAHTGKPAEFGVKTHEQRKWTRPHRADAPPRPLPSIVAASGLSAPLRAKPQKKPLPPAADSACGIVDVTGCRYAVADAPLVPGGYLFCNAKPRAGSSYCECHADIVGAPYSAKLIAHTVAGAKAAMRGTWM